MNNNSADNDYRHSRIQAMRASGIEPYTQDFQKSCNLLDIRQDFSHVTYGGVDVNYDLCGRIIGFRHEGKQLFIEVEEQQAQLLFVLQPESIDISALQNFKTFVLSGDYVGFTINKLFRTDTRELTARIVGWKMIAPCFFDPPFDAVVDSHHHRHLQLIVDRSIRRRFVKRSKIVRYIRYFLGDQFDFLETILPPVQPEPDFQARQSNLHRLLVGGIEAVYDMVNISGAESLERCGYPQSQLLECYKTFADSQEVMLLIERMICELTLEFFGSHSVPNTRDESTWREVSDYLPEEEREKLVQSLNLTPDWRVEKFYDLVKSVTRIDFRTVASVSEAIDAVHSHDLALSTAKHESVAAVAGDIAAQYVFPTLIQPTFVVDFPAALRPYYQQCGAQSGHAEYFELYINGLCLADGGRPHNDPDSVKAYQNVHGIALSHDDDVHIRLIHALKCGLPPVGCFHLSVDRLVMLLTNAKDIASVVYFPMREA